MSRHVTSRHVTSRRVTSRHATSYCLTHGLQLEVGRQVTELVPRHQTRWHRRRAVQLADEIAVVANDLPTGVRAAKEEWGRNKEIK